MSEKNKWTDKSGFIDAGPATGKEGDGHPNARTPETGGAVHSPDWTDVSGYVDAGPATGKEGDGHPDAKGHGNEEA